MFSIISHHRYIEISGGMLSIDFIITLFSLSSCNRHPPGKKFYQFVELFLFYDGLIASVFSSQTRFQQIDDAERPHRLFPFSNILFVADVLASVG